MDAVGQDLLAVTAVAGRICVGLVFVVAATQKAMHWRILHGVIASYRLLPHALVAPVSALLPPVEMALGLALLAGRASGWTALAAIALLGLFAAAMAINLRRGRAHIDCGCGQSFLKQGLNWSLVARNGVLAALLLVPLPHGAVSIPQILVGVGAGVTFLLLYLLLNTISALTQPQPA